MKLSNSIKKIFKLFQQFNKQIYLVGGCVRDIIMGNTPHDFDFTTDATPDEMKKIAASANIEIIPTGEKYGTLTFHIDKEFYEITTFRADGNYSDGRRPDEVVFSKKLKDDLCRRDFTFNAMCFAFDEKTNGVKLVDLYSGREDIKNRVVRTIGKAEDRFTEDALRMLRALRFACRFDFQLSTDIKRAIITQVNLLDNVSMERIREELFQILKFYNYNESNEKVLGVVLNKILGNNQIDFIGDFEDVWVETKILYCLNFKLNRNEINNELVELKCGNKFIKDSLTIYDCYKYLEQNKKQDFEYSLKWCLNKCSKDIEILKQSLILFVNNNCEFLFDFEDILEVAKNTLENNKPITLADLAINGDDLKNQGFKGKQIGEILQSLQIMVWKEPNKNNQEQIEKWIKLNYIH